MKNRTRVKNNALNTVREKNVPVFGKFVVSRLQFRQFCFDLKEKVDILKPGFWATK